MTASKPSLLKISKTMALAVAFLVVPASTHASLPGLVSAWSRLDQNKLEQNKLAQDRSPQDKAVQDKPNEPKYNLRRTIEAAIKASSTIDIARRQVQLDAVKLSEAGSPLKPSLSFSASETRFDKPTVIDFGSVSVTALHDHLEVLQAQLTQTLDVLGHVRNARSEARLQQAADVANLEGEQLNKALEAKVKYLNFLRASHQVDVAQAALAQAKGQESTAKKLYDNGVGQKVDFLRAQSNSSQAEQNLNAAKNDLDVAKATFNDLVGRPLDTPVELEDVAGMSVGADLEKSGPVGSDPESANPAFKLFTAPVERIAKAEVAKAIGDAQVRRPEVLRATALLRASEVGIRIAHQSIEPSFTMSLTGDKYPTTSLSYPRSTVGALTISATFPILDGGVARDEVKQATVRADQQRTELTKTKSNIALAVKTAYNNLLTSAKQLDSANANLRTAIAARQLAQVRYASQVGLFLEVSDAQAALVRAESEQVDAVYTYFSSLANYEAALGIPISSQTNSLSSLADDFPAALAIHSDPVVPPTAPKTTGRP
jgi:outer membrane protein TolC